MLSEMTMNLVSPPLALAAWTSCRWCSPRWPSTLHCSLTRCRGRPWPRHNTLHRGQLSTNLTHNTLNCPHLKCFVSTSFLGASGALRWPFRPEVLVSVSASLSSSFSLLSSWMLNNELNFRIGLKCKVVGDEILMCRYENTVEKHFRQSY